MRTKLCTDCRRNYTSDPVFELCYHCWKHKANKKCVKCKRFHVSDPRYRQCYFCWIKDNEQTSGLDDKQSESYDLSKPLSILYRFTICVIFFFLLSIFWEPTLKIMISMSSSFPPIIVLIFGLVAAVIVGLVLFDFMSKLLSDISLLFSKQHLYVRILLLLFVVYGGFLISQTSVYSNIFLNIKNSSEKIIDSTSTSFLEAKEERERSGSLGAFTYLNQLRQQYGLAPLIWDERIYQLARFRSQDMLERKYFDHVSPEGKCAMDFAAEYGITGGGDFAENIGGTTYDSATGNPVHPYTEAIDRWMDSRGHRYALLFPTYLSAAIGCYSHYCTFLGYGNNGFVCASGAQGLEYWNRVPTQPYEK